MQKDISDLFKESRGQSGDLISIILPLYNEAESIPEVIHELYEYLENNQKPYLFEITFIDDCSTDSSFDVVITESTRAPKNVKLSIIKLAKNSGSHIAITAGINISRGNFCIIMASDGQDPATVIGSLIDEWKKGNDLVLASRSDNLDHSAFGNFISKLAWKMMKWSTRINMPENGCDLLGMDKKVVGAFNKMNERNTTFIFRILSLGFRQKEIQYIKRKRIAGKTKWTFLKKISIMIDAITGFSSRPLRLITNFGMLIFIVLVLRWMLVVVKIYILKQPLDDLTIILNTIFTSLAVIVLLLGFIGDYIWRILDETRKRPLYEISEIKGEIFNDNPPPY